MPKIVCFSWYHTPQREVGVKLAKVYMEQTKTQTKTACQARLSRTYPPKSSNYTNAEHFSIELCPPENTFLRFLAMPTGIPTTRRWKIRGF